LRFDGERTVKKKANRFCGVIAFALVLSIAGSAQARDLVWAGCFSAGGGIHVYSPAGTHSKGFITSFDHYGGMTTVGDEVWWGPAGFSILGRSIVRYDLDGNWLGSLSDPLPGLIASPIDAPTHAMTSVGDEVWWFGTLLSTTDVYYRLDSTGSVLGTSSFAAQIANAGLTGFAMTTISTPDVPSIPPIALWTLVPGLLVGSGLLAMRRRSGSVAPSSADSWTAARVRGGRRRGGGRLGSATSSRCAGGCT
jgi:hypothetical protein